MGSKNSDVTWALVGDSHAGVLITNLDNELRKHGQSSLALIRSGCPYSPGFDRSVDLFMCSDWSQKVRTILESNDIKNIVFVGRHITQLEGIRFHNLEGGKEEEGLPASYWPINHRDVSEAMRRELVYKGYKDASQNLIGLGKHIVIVYPIPEVGWNVPVRTIQLSIHGLPVETLTTSYYRYKERTLPMFNLFNSIQSEMLTRIYPHKLFCNSFVAGRCATNFNGISFYSDDDHLSDEGAKLVVQ